MPLLKSWSALRALRLRLVGVHRRRFDLLALEMAHDAIGAVLRAREHEHRIERLFAQQSREQCALSIARHRIDRVRHGARCLRAAAHLHDDRLAQILPRQRLDFGRHRGAEQQRLAVARDLGDDAIDLRREAHVEHAIRFVEHEHLEIVEHDVLPLEMIDQPARRRDDDVDAGAQLLLLRIERHAAVHRHDAQMRRGVRTCGRSLRPGRRARASA